MTVEAIGSHGPHRGEASPGGLAQIRARLTGRFKLGLYARQTRYGLGRDLTHPFTCPDAKIPIAVRPFDACDVPALFAAGADGDDLAERLEVAWRLAFIDRGAHGGFVAVDARNDTPCYVQWLLGPRDNDFIARLGGFPPLAPGEALLENAYTPRAYRGLGIMAAAMARIAERGIDLGARHVLTFVDDHNVPSLKGCQRAGFNPRLLHHRTRLCFGVLTWDRFETLPDGDPRRTAAF